MEFGTLIGQMKIKKRKWCRGESWLVGKKEPALGFAPNINLTHHHHQNRDYRDSRFPTQTTQNYSLNPQVYIHAHHIMLNIHIYCILALYFI